VYKYNKDELKESLTLEQVADLVAEFGGEPQIRDGMIVSKTICHNPAGEGSYKLYYYENTHLFRCYTDCGETFDIFELVQKIKNNNNEQKTYYSKEGILTLRPWQLFDAVEFVAIFFGYSITNENFSETQTLFQDWEKLNKYDKINSVELKEKTIELRVFDKKILNNLPRPHLEMWEDEGITYEVMMSRGIAYDPKRHGIVIPHYDINNNLIGIRERTLVEEEEKYGKYKPAIFNGKMYNHPLGFNLYNINKSKDNIKNLGIAIVGEGEKFCLTYASYFGMENDITVACCGSSLIWYQVELLLSLGVREIVVAFDKQFKEVGDAEWERWTKKLKDLHKKYGSYVQISFMFDKEDLLGYKDSPIDCGPDTFVKLFQERIYL
jgi:hypothetical protein